MKALDYLNNVVNNKYSFVPDHLTDAVVKAAIALGIKICGGLYDPETKQRVLYLA